MRIAMISPTTGNAFGQERVMRDSIALLQKAGHSVFLYGDAVVGELPQAEKVRLFPGLVRLNLLKSPIEVNSRKEEVLKALGEDQIEIVHFIEQFDFRLMGSIAKKYPTLLTAHTVAPSCPASHRLIYNDSICHEKSGLACLLHNKKYGCLSQSKSDVHRLHLLQEYLFKRGALKHFKAFLAISQYVKQTLIEDGFSEKKVHLVYNPVTVESVTGVETSPTPLIVMASRLVALKGISYFIKALKTMESELWTAWICGEGPERKNLEAEVARLGLGSRIIFKGQTSLEETARCFKSAHCVVQTNVGPEGFGMSVAEAQALGVPVIAFDVPALNEIILNGKTGFLVPPKNADALAETMTTLLKNPELQERLGQAAAQSMKERFSPTSHLEATLKVYQSIL